MLFLIQWLGGAYCMYKMGAKISSSFIYSIFIGWLAIIFYIIENLGDTSRRVDTTANENNVLSKENTISQVQLTKENNLYVKNGILLKLDTPIRIHPLKKQVIYLNNILIHENLVTLCADNLCAYENIQLNLYNQKIEYIENINCKDCEEYIVMYDTLLYDLMTAVGTGFDIWQGVLSDNTRDMCDELMNQMNEYLNFYKVKTQLTEKSWYFFYDNELVTFEKIIRKLPAKNGILLELDKPIRVHLQKMRVLFVKKIVINENSTTLCIDNQGIKLNIDNRATEYIKNVNYKYYEKHIVTHDTLLYVLATTISTCFDIWQGLLPYSIKDMCDSMTNQMNVHLNSYGIKTELTEKGWYFFYNNKLVTFEEVVRKLPANIPFQEYKTNDELHMTNIMWKYENINIKSSYDSAMYSVIPDGTIFFTESSYLCPSCNRFMNKILLNQSTINVSGENKTIDKAFSCKYCNEFFAPVLNQRLNNGFLYHLKTDNLNYKSIVKDMDSCGRQNKEYSNQMLSKVQALTEPKHPNLEEPKEEQLFDKQIKERFYQMLSNAQQEIFIISPWISAKVTEQVLPILKKVVTRGVKVHIIYGIFSYNSEDIRNKTSKEQIQRYQRELGNALIIKEDSTHVKVCICDDSYLIGSYNFLSCDADTSNWHELCSYGKNPKKVQILKQQYFN